MKEIISLIANRMPTWAKAPLGALLLFQVFACGAGGNTAFASSAGDPAPTAPPAYGDALVSGTLGEPSNLLSFLSSDVSSREVSGQIYTSLLEYDKNLNIVPLAAESFQVLDGGLKLAFTLRRDLVWQDGVPLTAADVEFTYKLMIDPDTGTAYSGDYLAVKGFKVLDPYHIEIMYDKPFARSLITWMGDIMPKHLLEGAMRDKTLRASPLARRPVGAGPFEFKEWKDGINVTLTANRKYFKGRPNLDGLVYQIIPDNSTMFMELTAGKIDIMGLSPQQYLYQGGTEAFKERFNIYKELAHAYTYLGYNLKSPLFADVRTRRAIALALDKGAIIKGALLGQGVPTIGPYRPGTWAYNERIKDYPRDLAAAVALLAECGWTKRGADGVLVDGRGRRFSFTLMTNQGNEMRVKTAVIIQSQLKELGIEVKIRTVEWAAFLREFINTGHFDALIMGWTVTQDPDVYDVWHSSRAKPGGLNFVSYINPETDNLLEEARTTFDQAKRKELYDRFQVILHADQPYCFLYVPYAINAVDKRFNGIEECPAGIGHNLARWWVSPSRQRYRTLLTP